MAIETRQPGITNKLSGDITNIGPFPSLVAALSALTGANKPTSFFLFIGTAAVPQMVSNGAAYYLNGRAYIWRGASGTSFSALPTVQGGGWEAIADASLTQSGAVAVTGYTVSLANGKTMGTLKNGDRIAAGTPYDDSFFRRALIENIYPSYSPASLTLTPNAPSIGEVGEAVALTLTATFNQNDAGPLTSIRIQQGATVLGTTGTASPLARSLTFNRPNGTGVFQGFVSYAAGPLKPVPPAGTPDDRAPAVGSPNAPQAAQTDLASNTLSFSGLFRLFYGATASASTSSGAARALSGTQLAGTGQSFTLLTGNTQRVFELDLPPGFSVRNIVDLDALNKDVTGEYLAGTLTVNDAGGTGQPYSQFVKTQAVPYDTSHRHLITLN